jgi:hypothetical protein
MPIPEPTLSTHAATWLRADGPLHEARISAVDASHALAGTPPRDDS